jgi:anti-anti-sigma regulatory factor
MTTAAPERERIVRLVGELDMARRAEVRGILAAHDDGEPLVVDLSGCDFADHQTVLLLLRRRGLTELRDPPPSVERVRAALGL